MLMWHHGLLTLTRLSKICFTRPQCLFYFIYLVLTLTLPLHCNLMISILMCSFFLSILRGGGGGGG